MATNNFGFVYAACGQGYTDLAHISASSLRNVCPDAQIDLFTDSETLDDSPFDQVFGLNHSWFRPKFEALIRARFERSIYLDADTFVTADISDIFVVLERHEFAAAPVIRNNYILNRRRWKSDLPLSVPRYNCGLIGIQNTERTIDLLKQAEQIMIEENLDHDQSLMRELLFLSDLRIVTLPYEYNVNELTYLDILSDSFCAPRVLHFWRMREHLEQQKCPQKMLAELLGPNRMRFLKQHMANDASLGAHKVITMKPRLHRGLSGALRKIGM